MTDSPTLKAIRAAYYEAGRVQPADYPPLPPWQKPAHRAARGVHPCLWGWPRRSLRGG